MSAPATSVPLVTAADANREHRAFLWKKLHSLSGVIPVGVFLIEHLWTNSKALQGEDAFNQAVGDIQALPYLPLIEVFGIFVPLAFHSFYGLYLAFRGRPNALRYRYGANWLYVLQRVTGVLAFAFICCHLWEFRVQKWLFGMRADAMYQVLEGHLSSTYLGVPWMALFYVLGVASVVFHFANGLAGVCMSWGLTVTKVAQRRAAMVCGALGVALFVVGINTVVFFATGYRFYLKSDITGAGIAPAPPALTAPAPMPPPAPAPPAKPGH